MHPKIIIRYNRLLDPIFVFYCQNAPELAASGWHQWQPPHKEELDRRIANYRATWDQVAPKILEGMCSVLGLQFRRNIIDVHIVSGNPRQLSWPLVMKSGFAEHDFVAILSHELIHVLLADNEEILPSPDKQFSKIPDLDQTARNHIIVHAVLKYLYLEVLDRPDMLEQNIQRSQQHRTTSYTLAWEIVDKSGYKELIAQFKADYKISGVN